MSQVVVSVDPGRIQLDAVRAGSRIGSALVIVSCFFNLVLCFINTKGWLTIGTILIVGVQLLILSVGLYGVRHRISSVLICGAGMTVALVLTLKMLNPSLDLKILFDLAVAPVFTLLGRGSSVERADQLVKTLLVIVITIGLVELPFPDWYVKVFDIWNYYINKGAIGAHFVNYTETHFLSTANDLKTVETYPLQSSGRTVSRQFFWSRFRWATSRLFA